MRILFLLLAALPAFGQFGNAKKINGKPVDTTAPSDGSTLVWSASQGKWVSSGSGGTLTIGTTTLDPVNGIFTPDFALKEGVPASNPPATYQTLYFDPTSHLLRRLNSSGSASDVGGVSSVFTRTGAVTATTGDYTAAQVTNAVDSTASYSNPSWITALAYAKITGVPSFAAYGTLSTTSALTYVSSAGTITEMAGFTRNGNDYALKLEGTAQATVQLRLRNAYNSGNRYCDFLIPYDSGPASWACNLQGRLVLSNSGQPIYINASSLAVGPASFTPSGTLHIQDATASTGATRVTVSLGAADSASTVTVTNAGTTKSAGYQSSDGSAGITGATCSSFKNGLCVAP